MEEVQQPAFKLNLKRTFLIGFAFFGILLLWQVYDSWCPPLLTELFKNAFHVENDREVQYLVGIMMAIDNLAALILLPIFGRLSDKTRTPIGKRMPYILAGTAVCAIAFPFIPVFYHFNKVGGVIAMMAIVVIFAMMYRNPAVALMPDVTPKPLRSKANAIINLMGSAGGIIALGFMTFLSKDYKSYIGCFACLAALMIVSLVIFLITVNEPKLVLERK